MGEHETCYLKKGNFGVDFPTVTSERERGQAHVLRKNKSSTRFACHGHVPLVPPPPPWTTGRKSRSIFAYNALTFNLHKTLALKFQSFVKFV